MTRSFSPHIEGSLAHVRDGERQGDDQSSCRESGQVVDKKFRALFSTIGSRGKRLYHLSFCVLHLLAFLGTLSVPDHKARRENPVCYLHSAIKLRAIM